MQQFKRHHRGRVRQIPIYLGKFFRMFIYMNDWKVIPMAAVIAALVSTVACADFFRTMEGAVKASMALTCACLWNGCFNSIQVVCREREIIKREHRSGMHIAAYLGSHMIYQGFLCLLQSAVTLAVCQLTGIRFPADGYMTYWLWLDLGITLFLITYAADMMSLMISCLVHNTTAAMTVMPLVLIFQLVLSGVLFSIPEAIRWLSNFTIARWGIRCVCSLADYNSRPMVSLWNQMIRFCNYDIDGTKPVYEVLHYMEEHDLKDTFLQECGRQLFSADYAATVSNIARCWGMLILFALSFALCAMILLKFIDRDKR